MNDYGFAVTPLLCDPHSLGSATTDSLLPRETDTLYALWTWTTEVGPDNNTYVTEQLSAALRFDSKRVAGIYSWQRTRYQFIMA